MAVSDPETTCPGCGLILPSGHGDPPHRCNSSAECFQLYSDLMCYTVAKQDREFIHQHAVDAYAAQHAGGTTRNITVSFGLIGLYLAMERDFTGRQVQQAHMKIARIRKEWPQLVPPEQPASITVLDVLQAPEGEARDAMIREWMASVWESWKDRQVWVQEVTDPLLERGGK